MSSNKDFLPSSSPRSSICAVEIEAILFLFMMNCYKSSFQECITSIVLKIERQGTSRHIVYFSYKKKEDIPPPPVRLSWDSPHPPPESVRAYADVRTKIFRLTHGAPRAPLKFPIQIRFYQGFSRRFKKQIQIAKVKFIFS